MSEHTAPTKPKRLWLQYLITAAIGAGASVAIAFGRGLSAPHTGSELAAICSDGLFVTGLLLTALGLLIWIATTGFFDIFSYAFKSLLLLFSSLRKPQDHIKYVDYKAEKEEKRHKSNFVLLFTGIGFILLSLLCLWLYYTL